MTTVDPMTDVDADASTAALVKEVVADARELIKLEVALARKDVEAEITRVRAAAIAFAVAAFASGIAVAMVLVAIAIASGAPAVAALVSALVLLAIAATAGEMGRRRTGAAFLHRTRERMREDLRELGESAHGA
jgi:hypothetical protein